MLRPSAAAFLGATAGSWVGSRAARTSAGAPVWDASVTGGGLTCCA